VLIFIRNALIFIRSALIFIDQWLNKFALPSLDILPAIAIILSSSCHRAHHRHLCAVALILIVAPIARSSSFVARSSLSIDGWTNLRFLLSIFFAPSQSSYLHRATALIIDIFAPSHSSSSRAHRALIFIRSALIFIRSALIFINRWLNKFALPSLDILCAIAFILS
jgi:hypothetical protein